MVSSTLLCSSAEQERQTQETVLY